MNHPRFNTLYAQLISLDRRYVVGGHTRVVGFVTWPGKKKQRVLFSDKRWPVAQLRYYLGTEIAVLVDPKGQRVMPVPLELQPKRVLINVPETPADIEWLNALPCITDAVVERPTEPPARKRFFISPVFAERVRREAELEETERVIRELGLTMRQVSDLKESAEEHADELRRFLKNDDSL